MANKKDFYEVLGVSKNSSDDEIKAAYKKLALKYHPDRNKEAGAEQKFIEIQEAYDVLKDPEKRKTYDTYGSSAFENGGFGNGGGNPFEGFGGGQGFGGFEDIFSAFGFGGSQRSTKSNGPRNGSNKGMNIQINFMDSILGKKITIPNYSYDKKCPHCDGSGAESPSDISTCPKCRGKGTILTQRQTLFGMMQSEETCPSCNGTGKQIKRTCHQCGGNRFIKVKEDLDINIPAGISSGQQIRVSGKGGAGALGGKNGDLYIEVTVAPHQYFKREGNDIHITIPVDFIDATLGTTVEVPDVYGGKSALKVAPGTQPGTLLRMRDKGVKDLRNGKPGSQIVHLDIKTPTNLNKKQKEALNDFKKNESENIFSKFIKNFKR